MFRSKRSARSAASNLVQKYGRFGEFIACSNYPKCKYVKQKTIGVPCPNCSEGEIVERRSKRGRRSSAAIAIPNAISLRGASRSPRSARIAAAAI